MVDVANKAGVSLMTVSRVINKKGDVANETRQRVQAVIEALGYRPSGIARSLATQRTATIGLIVPDIANPYFSGIAHGVAETAYGEDFSLLLCDCNEDPQREVEMLDVLEDKRVDGVIIAAPRLDSAQLLPVLERHENVIIINRLFQQKDSLATVVGYVVNDDQSGSRSAVNYLFERGHTRIGLLAGPQASYGSQRRMLGYQAAFGEAGLAYRPEWVRHCPPTFSGGLEAAGRLLREQPELTGLFCFNDLVAIGVLQACAGLQKRVPHDLAVVGYDDIPMASWVNPPLSTCQVAFEEMGRLAMQLLIRRLEDCVEECQNIVLTPQMISRASA
jgi:LacI family transcriptional regulator